MEYPSNVNTSVYWEEYSNMINQLSDLTDSGSWDEALELLSEKSFLVNLCRLPPVGEMGKLYTPLHQAAYHKAPKEVFEKLLSFRASKTLKTAEGKTAYDIAKENDMSEDILNLIELPEEIRQNAEDINRMEIEVHKIMNNTAGTLLKDNGQSLPQLAFFYEFGPFWCPVGGMYGGFHVERTDRCENAVEVYSFCRIVGGSERRYLIKRNGKVKLVEKGYGYPATRTQYLKDMCCPWLD